MSEANPVTFQWDYTSQEMTTSELVKRLREIKTISGYNLEAADRLEALEVALNSAVNALENLGERAVNMEAENKRLREVLGEIANHPTGGIGCNPVQFVEAARAALKETGT
jgi:hypothetical protein